MRIANRKGPVLMAAVCLVAGRSARTWGDAPPPITAALALAKGPAPKTPFEKSAPARNIGSARPQAIIMLAQPRTARQLQDIALWIHQLSSDHYRSRQAAKKKLIAAGTAAVPALTKALNGWTTPGLREAIRTALADIAKAAALRGPRVTLQLVHAPLREILRRLCGQIGLLAQVSVSPDGLAQRLTINVQRQPFWKVIRRIAQVTHVSPDGSNLYGRGLSLYFSRPGWFGSGMPMAIRGPMLMTVESSSLGQNVTFDVAPGSRALGGLGVEIAGFWASADTQVMELGPVRFRQATDDRGENLLAPVKPSASYWTAPSNVFSCAPNLRWPSARAKAIRLLRSVVPLTLAIHPRTWLVGHLRSGKARLKINGIHVTIGPPTGVIEDPADSKFDRCTIRVTITTNSARSPLAAPLLQALPWNPGFIFMPSVGGVLGFQSAGGRRLSCEVGPAVAGPSWSHEIQVRGGLPASAWVKLYTRVIRVHVPFLLKNVPIPSGLRPLAQSHAAVKALRPPPAVGRPVPPVSRLFHLTMPSLRPSAAVPARLVNQWLGALAGPHPAARNTALTHLVAAGNTVLPLVQRALKKATDPALRKRLFTVLDSIAATEDLRGPLVTLNLKNVSVLAVLGRLCSQVGVKPDFSQVSGQVVPRLSVHIQSQPFWPVLQRIAGLTQIGPDANYYGEYSRKQVEFVHYNLLGTQTPTVLDGAGLIAIGSVAWQHDLVFSEPPAQRDQRSFTIQSAVLWVPTHQQVVEQVGPLRAFETITNGRGKVLLHAPITGQPSWPQPPQTIYPQTTNLPWPPAGAAPTFTLRGVLPIHLASDRRTLRVGNLGWGHAMLNNEGMRLTFGKPRKIPGGWRMPLNIAVNSGIFYIGKKRYWMALGEIPLLARFTGHLFDGRELRLFSASGHLLALGHHRGGLRTNRGWGYYRYTMDVAGAKPASAKVNFFTRTVIVRIPFDFRNLPIPR